jgi:hypothetical protein
MAEPRTWRDLQRDALKMAAEAGREADRMENSFMSTCERYAEANKVSLAAAIDHVVKEQPELHKKFLEFQAAKARRTHRP